MKAKNGRYAAYLVAGIALAMGIWYFGFGKGRTLDSKSPGPHKGAPWVAEVPASPTAPAARDQSNEGSAVLSDQDPSTAAPAMARQWAAFAEEPEFSKESKASIERCRSAFPEALKSDVRGARKLSELAARVTSAANSYGGLTEKHEFLIGGPRPFSAEVTTPNGSVLLLPAVVGGDPSDKSKFLDGLADSEPKKAIDALQSERHGALQLQRVTYRTPENKDAKVILELTAERTSAESPLSYGRLSIQVGLTEVVPESPPYFALTCELTDREKPGVYAPGTVCDCTL